MTKVDVIKKAIEMFESGMLMGACYDGTNNPYCPYCAIANAKSELDKQDGSGLTLMDAWLYRNEVVDSDSSLIEAKYAIRDAIKLYGEPNSIDTVILLLHRAKGV